MNFNRKHLGWGLIVVGGVLQIVEGLGHADAQLNGINYDQTAIGAIVGPVESHLPVSVGWLLVGIGAATLWLVPLIKK